jgi:hypothetical protein
MVEVKPLYSSPFAGRLWYALGARQPLCRNCEGLVVTKMAAQPWY